MVEAITWRAIYRAGSWLDRFNKDGSENKYTDIRRKELAQFALLYHNHPILIIHLDEKKQLIYRRRVAMPILGPNVGTTEVVHIVGWQENRRGVNVQTICFVFQDGHIEVLDRFRENTRWFYSVKFLAEEEV